MKTTKLILITALMAIATLGFSFTESLPRNTGQTVDMKSNLVPLKYAMKIPGLYIAMHQQISPDFLVHSNQQSFTFRVKVHQKEYFVSGLKNEWVKFFSKELIIRYF